MPAVCSSLLQVRKPCNKGCLIAMSKANKSSCCVPAIAASTPLGVGTVSANKALNPPVLQTAAIPGAKRPVFGTSTPRIANDGEETRHAKPISPFRMTTTTVTNAEFRSLRRCHRLCHRSGDHWLVLCLLVKCAERYHNIPGSCRERMVAKDRRCILARRERTRNQGGALAP